MATKLLIFFAQGVDEIFKRYAGQERWEILSYIAAAFGNDSGILAFNGIDKDYSDCSPSDIKAFALRTQRFNHAVPYGVFESCLAKRDDRLAKARSSPTAPFPVA